MSLAPCSSTWTTPSSAPKAAPRHAGVWHVKNPCPEYPPSTPIVSCGRFEGHTSGIGRTRTTISLVGQSLLRLGFDLPELASEIGRSYRNLRDEKTELLPGTIEALRRFRKHGVRLALITNGTSVGQRAKIERFNLGRRFDHILIEGELGVGKPEREFYLAAMDALESCPPETWCVGDNLVWEVEAPQMLGIYSVWVDRFGVGLPAGSHVKPNRTVNSIAELTISAPPR